MIGFHSQTGLRYEINLFEDDTVEISRGSICCTPQTDTRILANDAYQMKARIRASIGPGGIYQKRRYIWLLCGNTVFEDRQMADLWTDAIMLFSHQQAITLYKIIGTSTE